MEQSHHSRQAFGTFAIWNELEWKAFFQCAAYGIEDTRLGNKKKRAAQAGPFEMRFKMLKATASHQDFVGGLR